MASVQMPRLSDSMETGKILRWLKKEGEDVKKGEPLVEIESDKANIEVEPGGGGRAEAGGESCQRRSSPAARRQTGGARSAGR